MSDILQLGGSLLTFLLFLALVTHIGAQEDEKRLPYELRRLTRQRRRGQGR